MEEKIPKETKPSNANNNRVSIKNLKYNDATKLRFFKLTDKQREQDLNTKTRLITRLPANSPSLKNTIQNINDIISMAETAEEAMRSISSITESIKENLASSNDPNDPQTHERVQDLVSEAKKIVLETSFGSDNLLDGSFGFRTVTIGEDPKDTITFSMPDLRKWVEKLEKIDTKSNIQEALRATDSVLAHVTGERSKMSALLDRLFNARYSQDIAIERMDIKPAVKSLWLSQ